MQLTSTLLHPLLTSATVVIDWTGRLRSSQDTSPDIDTEKLIEWVKSHPRRSNIHVYLRSDARNGRTRRLQRSLQTLGCTVIAKITVGSGRSPSTLTNFALREWQ